VYCAPVLNAASARCKGIIMMTRAQQEAETRAENQRYKDSNAQLRDMLLQLVGQTIRGIRVSRTKRGESIMTFDLGTTRFSFDFENEDIYIQVNRSASDYMLTDFDEGYILSPNYNHLFGRNDDDEVLVGQVRG